MRLHEPSLCQDPSLRQELASLARGCDFVLPSRFKKRLKAFQQVQVQTKEEPLPPASSQSIPTFYFPRGRPQGTVNVDAVIAKIERTFAQFPHERATMEDMGKVAKVGALRAASGQHHVHGLVLVFCFQDLKHSGDSVLTVVPNIEDRHACALLPSQMEQRSPLHFLSN
nr:serine/threonine-protein phosphatase 2A regulatory subunit B'' subunit beta-like [Equus asinus]